MELKVFYAKGEKELYLGNLYITKSGGKEVFSFVYDSSFLKSGQSLYFDPEIYQYEGMQYSKKGIFGFVKDSIPDRFGKLLLDEQERINAKKENRLPKKLTVLDYLIGVNDLTRLGALRFKNEEDIYLASDNEKAVPPYIYLRDIENASIEFERNGDFDKEKYRRLLLPGSSLGGARPKANIYFNDELYIAKFPSINDTYDVECWEMIAYELAKKCGINVPDCKIENYSSLGSTFLCKRFDREKGKRIHFVSFMTALEAEDGDSGDYSYLDLVSYLKTISNNIKKEQLELFKRLVFTYLINNVDNHLRNHGLLYINDGLELSPMFDINPSFTISFFALPLTFEETSKETILKEAKYYGLNYETAKNIYEDIANVIENNLYYVADRYNAKKKQVDDLYNIFSSRK